MTPAFVAKFIDLIILFGPWHFTQFAERIGSISPSWHARKLSSMKNLRIRGGALLSGSVRVCDRGSAFSSHLITGDDLPDADYSNDISAIAFRRGTGKQDGVRGSGQQLEQTAKRDWHPAGTAIELVLQFIDGLLEFKYLEETPDRLV